MTSPLHSAEHLSQLMQKSNELEIKTTLERDIFIVEDHIQRFHNKLEYDRTLTEEGRLEILKKHFFTTKQLQEFRKEVSNA
jgi:hypothetical protein